jgi:hypothetical protein
MNKKPTAQEDLPPWIALSLDYDWELVLANMEIERLKLEGVRLDPSMLTGGDKPGRADYLLRLRERRVLESSLGLSRREPK